MPNPLPNRRRPAKSPAVSTVTRNTSARSSPPNASTRPSLSSPITADAAENACGEAFCGAITTDRYSGYNEYERRQVCWAHLLRDFQALIDAEGAGKRIGTRLMEIGREMLGHWQRERDGTITRETMRRHVRRLQYPPWEALESGQRCRHAPTSAFCRDLFARFDQLWLFLEHPGVEPTNNAANRALRHTVIWRKLSFVTQAVERHFAHRPTLSLLRGV